MTDLSSVTVLRIDDSDLSVPTESDELGAFALGESLFGAGDHVPDSAAGTRLQNEDQGATPLATIATTSPTRLDGGC